MTFAALPPHEGSAISFNKVAPPVKDKVTKEVADNSVASEISAHAKAPESAIMKGEKQFFDHPYRGNNFCYIRTIEGKNAKGEDLVEIGMLMRLKGHEIKGHPNSIDPNAASYPDDRYCRFTLPKRLVESGHGDAETNPMVGVLLACQDTVDLCEGMTRAQATEAIDGASINPWGFRNVKNEAVGEKLDNRGTLITKDHKKKFIPSVGSGNHSEQMARHRVFQEDKGMASPSTNHKDEYREKFGHARRVNMSEEFKDSHRIRGVSVMSGFQLFATLSDNCHAALKTALETDAVAQERLKKEAPGSANDQSFTGIGSVSIGSADATSHVAASAFNVIGTAAIKRPQDDSDTGMD